MTVQVRAAGKGYPKRSAVARQTSIQENPAMTQVPLVDNLARMSDIHMRLKILREGLGLSMEQVSDLVGVSWQTIQQWENGKTAPKRKRLEDVAAALGTTVEHLVVGKEIDAPGADSTLAPIRKVIFKISAGTAGFSVEHLESGDDDPIFFTRHWLEQRSLDPAKLYATRVNGDSMGPTIRDGDVVVVDTEDVKRERDGIFAVNHEGEFTVKRLKYDLRRRYLVSDNPKQKAYPPMECTEGTQLLGRVVHLHRELL